ILGFLYQANLISFEPEEKSFYSLIDWIELPEIQICHESEAAIFANVNSSSSSSSSSNRSHRPKHRPKTASSLLNLSMQIEYIDPNFNQATLVLKHKINSTVAIDNLQVTRHHFDNHICYAIKQ